MQFIEHEVIRELTNEAAEIGSVLQVMSAQANFVSVLLDSEGWVLNALPMPLALCDKPFCCSLTLSQPSSALIASLHGVDIRHAVLWLVPADAGAFKA